MKILSLIERRNIAKNTLVYEDWHKIIKGTHTKEIYDKLNIPIYENDLKEYLNNNPIVTNLLYLI
jgi:hypothetical protein